MTTVTRRRPDAVAGLLSWLENEQGVRIRGLGLMSDLRIEDYVEGDIYVVRAEIPGIDADDIEVTLDEGVLTIRGERNEEQRERGHAEFHYGSFARSVRLPRHARTDDVTASCTDGVLEVRVQLEPSSAAPRSIPVQRAENGKS